MRIAITGTPGTGKHTIAEALGRRLGLKVTDLGSLAKKSHLVKKDSARDTLVVDVKKLRRFLPADGIIVSNYAELLPADLILVVRCRPTVLARRLAARGYSVEKMRENLEAECIDYCLLSALERNKRVGEVDNSRGLKVAVAKAHRMVSSGRLSYGHLDYSGSVDRLDRLISAAKNATNKKGAGHPKQRCTRLSGRGATRMSRGRTRRRLR